MVTKDSAQAGVSSGGDPAGRGGDVKLETRSRVLPRLSARRQSVGDGRAREGWHG
jgi:hypothetical protein